MPKLYAGRLASSATPRCPSLPCRSVDGQRRKVATSLSPGSVGRCRAQASRRRAGRSATSAAEKRRAAGKEHTAEQTPKVRTPAELPNDGGSVNENVPFGDVASHLELLGWRVHHMGVAMNVPKMRLPVRTYKLRSSKGPWADRGTVRRCACDAGGFRDLRSATSSGSCCRRLASRAA